MAPRPARVKCPFCNSDDTVVLAKLEDPRIWDVLCRRCKRYFGWDVEKECVTLQIFDYDPLEVELAVKGKWNTKVYRYEVIRELKLVGEEDWQGQNAAKHLKSS